MSDASNAVLVEDVDLSLLQGHRLVHALIEAGVPVALPTTEQANVAYLIAQGFRSLGHSYPSATHRFAAAGIDHATPRTWVGGVERPLIFPREFVDRCESVWSDRDLPFSFAGLITADRRLFFDRFQRATGERLPSLRSPLNRLKVRQAARTDRTVAFRSRSGQTTIWFSRRGRVFPAKLWDHEYFALMGRSQFVLCPDGTFAWSYRFFEAALCGAIPIAETRAPAYEGFHYHVVDDLASGAVRWSEEQARANRELAAGRVTAHARDLYDEVVEHMSPLPA